MSALVLNRYLRNCVAADLGRKMVFLGGPRQVGKTTFSQSLISHYREGHPGYLNWDDLEQRQRILSKDWPSD